MEIKSKPTKMPLIGVIVIYLFGIIIIAILFHASKRHYERGVTEIITHIGFTIFFIFYMFFLPDNIEEIIVDENGIQVKKKGILIKSILFSDIEKFSTTRSDFGLIGGVKLTDGYTILNIHLKNGEEFIISPADFENFEEMKLFIYEKTKEIWGY